MNRQRQLTPALMLLFLLAAIICHFSNALDNDINNINNIYNKTDSGGTEGTPVDTTTATTTTTTMATLPPQEQQVQAATNNDPCPDAKTCLECHTAAQVVSSNLPGKTCRWKGLLVDSTESDPNSINNNNNNNNDINSNQGACQLEVAKYHDDMCTMLEGKGHDGVDKTRFQGGLLLLVAVVVGLAYGRCKIMGAGSSFASVTSAATDLGSILNHSSNGRTTKRSETVPLANATTDDDEEWGWEDSSAGVAEIELGITSLSRGKNDDDDDDLNKALAMEKKSHIPTFAAPSTKTASGISTTTAPAVVPVPLTMQITSLGNKPPTRTVQKPVKSRKDDDLFASMGLAAKPTFAKQVPVTPSSAAVGATSWKNEAVPEPSADERWDDDGDLDDLLND